jgi:hypothetical protein
MAKFSILKGSTSVLVRIFIQDSSKTNGAGLAGLTNASSGLTCYVARDDDGNAAATQLSLSSGTRGTWSSGGFKEKDATNQPGVYELGLSNASLATGSRSCTYYLQGAANMAPCTFEIELTNVDNQSTSYGLILTSSSLASGTITTTSFAAGAITAAVTDSTFDNAIATSVLTNTMTEAYPAAGGTLTLASAIYTINQFLGNHSTSGTTWTIKKRDGSTTAKTYTLDSATTPTSLSETT